MSKYIVLLLFLLPVFLSAQTIYNLRFANGLPENGQFCIDIEMGFDVPGQLATSNLVFRYNGEAVSNPTIDTALLSSPLVYQVPTLTTPENEIASLNVVLNAATFGRPIDATPVRLFRICFDIVDANETVNLNWRVNNNAATVVFKDEAVPAQLVPGSLQNFSGSSFPVEWLEASVRLQGADALLSWTTASETNNRHYEIERALPGGAFEAIGQQAGAGNSQTQNTYDFVDPNVLQHAQRKLLYRIKQVDVDGQFSYSPQMELSLTETEALQVLAWPNAVQDQLNVLYRSPGAQNISLRILNAQGQLIWQTENTASRAEYQLNTSKWPAGIYYLSVFDEQEKRQLKVLKL